MLVQTPFLVDIPNPCMLEPFETLEYHSPMNLLPGRRKKEMRGDQIIHLSITHCPDREDLIVPCPAC
jgi:hypothetical protein